jgi:hypothetical protein
MVLLGYFLSQVDLVLLIFDFVFKQSLKDHAISEVQVFQTIHVAHEISGLDAARDPTSGLLLPVLAIRSPAGPSGFPGLPAPSCVDLGSSFALPVNLLLDHT